MAFKEELFPALCDKVRGILDTLPHCHGLDHTLRVWNVAMHIAEKEGGELWTVAYGAMLHDIGRASELDGNGSRCHAAVGAEKAADVMREIGVSDECFVKNVQECVRTHRYRNRAGEPPASLEAKIVFDADKLDSMGAIGIGRAFHFAGRIGARVHNTKTAALNADSYSSEDTAWREYLVKQQYLHEAMLTTEGKRLAEERHDFMRQFFSRLNLEVNGETDAILNH